MSESVEVENPTTNTPEETDAQPEQKTEDSIPEDKEESSSESTKEEGHEEEKSKKKDKKVDLLTIKVNSESVALNVLIGFIGIAQRRGVFAVNESAKIYEAIQFFMKPQEQ